MAERSKALVSGTSLFGGVGSNPTSVNPLFVVLFKFLIGTKRYPSCSNNRTLSRLAQLVERKTLNLVVEGSSPSVGIEFLFFSTPGYCRPERPITCKRFGFFRLS